MCATYVSLVVHLILHYDEKYRNDQVLRITEKIILFMSLDVLKIIIQLINATS